jgi:hypothetical protein
MDSILGRVIGIAITLILVVGVVIASSSLFSGAKASNAANDLTTLIANVQAAYATQPNFTNLNNTAVTNGKWAPSDMVTGAGGLINQWGGQVTVQQDKLDGNNTAEFDVVETAIPADACVKLVNTVPAAIKVTVGAASTTAIATDPAAVAGVCSAGSITLNFVMGH